MTPTDMQRKLNELMDLPNEIEWVEFKEAKRNIDFDDLGKYFSALSNEANLKSKECGWLVLGVREKPRGIVGTTYRDEPGSLDQLKQGVAEQTNNRITFTEIYELPMPDGRVLMFKIPPALPGIPTSWKGHFFGRNGESLGPLSLGEIEQIRSQALSKDWSAQVCQQATLNDLDPSAIQFARKQYKKKHPGQAEEIEQWDNLTFLNKAKVCISGQMTHAGILLLGREEAVPLLSPAIAQITWVLKDSQGVEKDYKHFGPPLILSVGRVFERIRNLTYRYIPNASLFPLEVSQYDPWVIREILHNAIAHQDYSRLGRINVVEEPESLLVTNLGRFMPGSVEEVLHRDAPPEQYRNPFLAQAMVNLNMIDTIGSGIKRMFLKQRERFFPMPDYDLNEPERVRVRLFGKILDENYTRLLIEKADLSLLDVMALDKVQKKHRITNEEFKSLQKQKLIEGRRPNLFVSAKIASVTGDKAAYIRHRAFDKEHYKKMVIAYLEQFGGAKRGDIDKLLMDKISDALGEKQKQNRIANLLFEMSHKDKTIYATGPRRSAVWKLP
ncbi:Predicted transcriptional regulator [uncultured Desulfobacterium sp.]|uniref:Predicted transcriptional regulator n=1 Tax=uncultured Desulfobacterium sp. TaxID=201089 RepID=A0A445N0Y8_9BACT|nr:Predicted transcriptional regulator [uncultured Desulfobacterium sp.]